MQRKEFSVRRSKETTKPEIMCMEPVFYYCKNCKSIFQTYTMEFESSPLCCSEKMKILEPKLFSQFSDKIVIDYKIFGGYDENSIKVFWKAKKEGIPIEWIYLRTFTGGQVKYVTNSKKTYVVFALADEDAYAYCDENPCLECNFRCKRGFAIYVYIKEGILISIPVDKMHANWK